jgi:hypothetical protein
MHIEILSENFKLHGTSKRIWVDNIKRDIREV